MSRVRLRYPERLENRLALSTISLLADLNQTTYSANPGRLVELNEQYFFKATDTSEREQLFELDPKTEVSRVVKGLDGARYSLCELVATDTHLFFFTVEGGDEVSSRSLTFWSSDGTAEGTRQLIDDIPGSNCLVHQGISVSNDLAYFQIEWGGKAELWRSDGTQEGTREILSRWDYIGLAQLPTRVGEQDVFLVPTRRAEFPTPVFDHQAESISWLAFNRINDYEIWSVDASAVPKRISETILFDTKAGELPNMFVSGDRLYVPMDSDSVENESAGNEILVTDGTLEGTHVLDVPLSDPILELPRTLGANPISFHTLEDGDVLFSGLNADTGNELWRTDGTNEGTYLVKDILPGPDSSGPNHFWQFDGKTYFEAITPENGREMWRTDGTESGTTLFKVTNPDLVSGGFRQIGNFTTSAGPLMLFAAKPEEPGNIVGGRYFVRAQIWISDGTAEGTHPFNGGTTLLVGRDRNDQYEFAAFDGMIAYYANGEGGEQLRFTDGTSDVLVNGSTLNSDFVVNIADLQSIGGKLFFTMQTSSGFGIERYVSDGTAEGTRLVGDLNQRSHGSTPIRLLGQLSNGRYLVATNRHLQSIDLRDGNRVNLESISGRNIGEAAALDDRLIFEYQQAVWVSDGTKSGTRQLEVFDRPLSNFHRIGDRIFFRVNGEAPSLWNDSDKSTLWETDSTQQGTQAVADIFVGDDTWPRFDAASWRAVEMGGKIYYLASEKEEAWTYLWSIDGEDEDPVAVTKLLGSYPAHKFWSSADVPLLSVWNEQLFFLDASGDHKALYLTDGTPGNRTLLTDQPVKRFLLSADYLYFEVVAPGDWEWERTVLWRTDGTVEGTINLGVQDPGDMLDLNGKVHVVSHFYFGSSPPILWATDGTGRMVRVTELATNAGTNVRLYDNNESMIIFSGGGLRESDGTLDGTNALNVPGYTVTEIPSDWFVGSDQYSSFDDQADGVFFTPTTLETGRELFRIHSEVESHPTVIDVSMKAKDGDPYSLESVTFQFDGDVGESLQTTDLRIRSNSNRGVAIDSLLSTMSWDPATQSATWDLASVEMGYDAYTLELVGKDVFDEYNNNLDGNGDGVNGDSFRFDFGVPIGGDIDLDGTVAFTDFLMLSENFGLADARRRDGDVDGDGTVSFADFLILSSNYGASVAEQLADG